LCRAAAFPAKLQKNPRKPAVRRRNISVAGICRSILAGKELRGMRLPAAIPAPGEYQPGIYFLHLQP
ncbi:hypothetical protein, partial [Alistipes finegoldii]|uniref:hypothetical protein n=1 Tax=Alistipes finegoldii TaxID=214856 RepID=UPI0025A31FD3